MIPSARTRAWLSKSARQYAYALWAAGLITVITVKMWWMTDPSLVTALNGPYGALVTALSVLIAACIGIQRLAPQPDPYSAEDNGDHAVPRGETSGYLGTER
jgi:hypothetical protein